MSSLEPCRPSVFYRLSTREDVLDWKETKWYYTPTQSHADLKALAQLPPTTLAVSTRFEEAGPEGVAHIGVENTGSSLAFQVRLKLVEPTSGEEILPVFWDDNYFELFPREKREIRVSYPRKEGVARPGLEVEAWNVAKARH